MLEKIFKLSANKTDAKTEVLAGITTFMTMAYILAVNPNILSATGMDSGAVFTATALAAFLGTLLMAIFANYPFALAPGMGLNAYFAYTVVIGMGYSWEYALTAVFAEGIVFIVLSLTNVREAIFNAIPLNLKSAVSVGIGLFIAFVGLQNANIVIGGSTLLQLFSVDGYNAAKGVEASFNNVGITVILALIGIIVTGILHDMLSGTGIVNEVLVNLHVLSQPINFFAHPGYFWPIVAFANVWKETGWNAIIYLAAITSIDPSLYEAAAIDGAGRWNKIKYVTLPGIKPTIVILLLMNVGNVLNAGFEIQYLLGNGLIQKFSQTIDIYVLKWGISQGDYAIGTAAGIFKSLVSIILIVLANQIAKHNGEEQLF